MQALVKNIIFLGASGQAGRPVFNSFLKHCLNAGLVTSALSRVGSSSVFPGQVTVLRTDYSPESLEEAFKGQDVIICMLGDGAFALQEDIIRAAIKAGVKRIFPSEFGCRTFVPKVVDLMPYFRPKRALIEWLKTQEDAISWTALIPGPFFDEALKNTFHGYEPPDEFYLLDGGDVPYGTTNLHTIGYALFKIISDPSHFAESANRYISIHSHITTQQDVVAALEKSKGVPFKKHHLNSQELYRDSLRRFHSRGPTEEKDLFAERDIIQCIAYGKGEFSGLGDPRDENDWTERLGLPAEDLLDDVTAVINGTRPERTFIP